MTSDAYTPPPDLSSIDTAADLVRDVPQPPLEERLSALESAVEFLTEERGRSDKYREQLTQYVEDLRAEVRFIGKARKVFGTLATLVGIGLLITPVILAYSAAPLFESLPPYPKAALLIGMIAGGVLLIQGLTKSVYRSGHERQTDEFIPPQIKAIHDLTRGKE